MKKRILCMVLTVAMMVSAMCITSTPASAISDADFVAPEVFIPEYLALPDNDLITDGESFTLAEGTRNEIDVVTQFVEEGKAWRPGTINYMKYIVVHNTGSYPSTSTALSNHNYGRTSDASVSWHYTCGNDGIYQMLPVNEKGWHAGGNYWTEDTLADKVADGSNSTGIGIETCVDGFPADAAFSGEHWNSPEMYEWYETHYDSTATYLAMLVAYICVNLNFNPYTQIITHYQTAAKNCPMQMRYVFGTNASFRMDGTYYKVFLDRMYDYYEAFGGTYTSADSVQNVYYNPSYKSYDIGLYKANSAVTVYRAGNTATGSVGTVAAGSVVDVDITGWNWGKVTLADGTTGWVNLDSLTYVTGDYDYGTYKTASGDIVEVTAIDGNTATYEGGTADISTLTRVYKVTVEGDTAFGSESKYLAKGETFTVTSVEPEAPMLFDVWEVTYGIASIEEKTNSTTTVTVLNSDIVIKSTARDEFDLIVSSGTGSGRYAANSTVEISAASKVGYTFSYWKIDSGSGTFADANAVTTTFTTSQQDTSVSPVYEQATYFDNTGLENYALNKSYSFTFRGVPAAELADKSFWYSAPKSRDENCTKMTDGETEDDTTYANDPKYSAVVGTAQPLEYIIDLGQSYEVSRVVIHDIVIQSSWGDIGSFSVALSADGVTFEDVQNFSDSIFHAHKDDGSGNLTKLSESLYTHCVDFVPAYGRYIKVSFSTTKYVCAYTEIEVLGLAGQSETTSDIVLGDVNEDGEIDSLDAAAVLKYDAGILTEISEAGDVNGDGEIDSLDAAAILKYDAGLIEEF